MCRESGIEVLHTISSIPVHHALPDVSIPKEKDFAFLEIAECNSCGHIYNAAFDPDHIDDLYYKNLQTNRPVHRTMTKALEDVCSFIMSDQKSGLSIMEIGGGTGEVSRAMANSARRFILVEPSQALTAEDFSGTRVELIADFFPTDVIKEKFDIIICRQVLEHTTDPLSFLTAVRAHLKPEGTAYIEVPRMDYIVENLSPIDFHYAHVQYFFQSHLKATFLRTGLEPYRSCHIKDGHDIGYMLKAVEPKIIPRTPNSNAGISFAGKLKERIDLARQRLRQINGTMALYGATVYSQAFMGLFPEFEDISIVFDDTESYAGSNAYGPFGRVKIGVPTAENLVGIDTIIIAAHLHDQVIYERLLKLGFGGIVYSVRPDQRADKEGLPPSLFHP